MSAELFGDYPYTSYRSIDLNATGLLVKAGLSCIYNYYFYNLGGVTVYIKLYDKASGPDNTDTPIRTLPLGPTQGAQIATDLGILFENGIGIRCTTGLDDSDNTSPDTSSVIANLGYR